MMLCSQARESLKNIPNPSLRPDLTPPYAKPYLWTPVPYARMFFQNSFVNFLTFPLSGLFFVAHLNLHKLCQSLFLKLVKHAGIKKET